MLRFLTDEDFDGRLISALLNQIPALDLVRVQEIGLMSSPDPDILNWAASQGRIVLTRDRRTMTAFAGARISAGQPMPGLFVIDQLAPLGQVLDDLRLMIMASEMADWQYRIVFVPL